jgi:mono/diheme cytochrome c family protein
MQLESRPAARFLALAFVTLAAACGGAKDQPAASSSAAAPPAAPAGTMAAAAGSTQYAVCAVCHQATGLGLPNTFPPLAGSEIVNGKADAHIRIVLQGVTGPFTVKGMAFNNTMPAQGAAMTDDDIAAVINYERSSWGNTGASVTAAQVAAIRAATATRTTPWTEAELKAFR